MPSEVLNTPQVQDLFAEDATPPLEFAPNQTPTDGALRQIATASRQLAIADARLKRAEALCDAIRARRTQLAMKTLPDLFDTAQTDRAGLPEMNCDVVVENYYHAAIKADWPTDDRARAFDHLEALDAGSLVRATLSVDFDKADLPIAKRLREIVNDFLHTARIATPATLDLAVNWRTLTSWVRDYVETPRDPHATPTNAPKFQPEVIGATIGRICKIVPRKPPRQSRGRRK
jgi:hypothetical protein